MRLCLLLLFAAFVTPRHCPAGDEPAFDAVAAIFEKHCLECHNTDERKGGLSLQTREHLDAGGDSGPPIVAQNVDQSFLLDMTAGDKPEMPRGRPPLSAEQLQTIRNWIETGAHWPDGRELQDRSLADSNWWSLQPLVRPPIPITAVAQRNTAETREGEASAEPRSTASHPIDAFIHAKLSELGFIPAPEADRRTLIRRLSFDLIGLPPSPEAVDAFVNDPDELAYEKLVDQLLASSQYGERWARHWLDVVHFGETHGYDKDQPRPNAWPYRDYVIRSFNADKSYSQFIEEQIAGDVLYPQSVDGIEALGFIAAGPWDFIGHVEVPESKIDGKVARHLDRDDMVSNTIGTFNSLTVGCAQCHNHKFDPIRQEDYYRLQAVFAAVDRADRKYHSDPEVAARYARLERQLRDAEATKKQLDAEVATRGGTELTAIDAAIVAARSTTPTGLRPEYGYHSAISAMQDVEKWVQLDLGAPREITDITCVGCFDDFNQIGAGFGFPVRYRIEASDDPTFASGTRVLVDQTQQDVPNPGTAPQSTPVPNLHARFVRLTATKLALRADDYILAMAELQVLGPRGENYASTATITALDSIEAPVRWRQSNLNDGIYPGFQAATPAESLESLQLRRDELLARVLDADLKVKIDTTAQTIAAARAELAALPAPRITYAATVHYGDGNFIGTGPQNGRPRPIHLLHRGDVKDPRHEVQPGSLQCIPDLPGDFPLSADHSEADRRAALARWISDRRNPLTWRSIVNRVWQYHFGRGLVETANDFGRMGQLPSHPELLEWLAVEFRDGGQSLKALHRLIVTSRTYRQRAQPDDEALDALTSDPRLVDSANVFLWRMNRRKLEAEAIRDAVLLVSGKLDLTMGGPSFQDFVVEHPEHSPHYEYHLYDPTDPRSHRRSVYRFLVRSQPQPFMTTLDCADPSMRVDKRNESLTPLQALALLNDGFMVTMSQAFSDRIVASTTNPREQTTAMFHLALSRPPTDDEVAMFTGFIETHGLANACRVIFNLNEFAMVD